MVDTKYKDIDLNFTRHPITNDIVTKTDIKAISQSIRSLVFLNFYEKPYHSNIGCGIRSFLFDNVSTITSLNIKTAIEQVIANFEPRAEVVGISVTPDAENNKYDVSVVYTPVNVNTQIDVSFILERLR